MEVQKIFAEIKENWGNEHEQKRKNIFRKNIIYNPMLAFVMVSISFLVVPAYLIIGSYISTGVVDESSIEISRVFFNFP